MKINALFFTLLLLPVLTTAQNVHSICVQMDQLNQRILLGSIKKQEAKAQLLDLMSHLKRTVTVTENSAWTFPLQHYKANAIGGTKGNGYHDKGYSFLDGNKHAAHPAHDIFIDDKDQDGLDDKTKQSVNVLALTDGIVLACSNEWTEGSDLRGGRFIWVYHPKMDMVSYYAHNKQIFVKPGDIVAGGQKIAEVGRTGLNAFKKRSPTHLHFGTYHLVNGIPVPFNGYQQLIRSRYL